MKPATPAPTSPTSPKPPDGEVRWVCFAELAGDDVGGFTIETGSDAGGDSELAAFGGVPGIGIKEHRECDDSTGNGCSGAVTTRGVRHIVRKVPRNGNSGGWHGRPGLE